jgi:hypothetical protein
MRCRCGKGDWEIGRWGIGVKRSHAKVRRRRGRGGMRKVGMQEEEGEGGGKMRGRKYGMAMCPGGG